MFTSTAIQRLPRWHSVRKRAERVPNCNQVMCAVITSGECLGLGAAGGWWCMYVYYWSYWCALAVPRLPSHEYACHRTNTLVIATAPFWRM